MKIIGLMGNSGVGKDTMANHLVSKYGFVKIAFADPFKRVVKDIYDFSENVLWGPAEGKNVGDARYPRPDGTLLSPRIAMQTIGSEWGRNCYPETWTKYLERATRQILDGASYTPIRGIYHEPGKQPSYAGIIISDCRFQNELDVVRRLQGYVVRLKRANVTESKSKQLGIGSHDSEMEQLTIPDSDLDFVIEVPEGIPNFHVAIDEFIKKL